MPFVPTRLRTRRLLPAAAAALVALVGLSACEDDPFGLGNWTANPDSLLLYSLDRPELNLPSAANLYQKTTRRVEAPGASGDWDIALDTQDGGLVFLPSLAFGIPGDARIATFPGMDFDDLREAPGDTAVYTAEAVPVDLNTTYVVRTNEYRGSFGSLCSYYAKLQPYEIDMGTQTVRFIVDSNPVCNQLALVPPNG